MCGCTTFATASRPSRWKRAHPSFRWVGRWDTQRRVRRSDTHTLRTPARGRLRAGLRRASSSPTHGCPPLPQNRPAQSPIKRCCPSILQKLRTPNRKLCSSPRIDSAAQRGGNSRNVRGSCISLSCTEHEASLVSFWAERRGHTWLQRLLPQSKFGLRWYPVSGPKLQLRCCSSSRQEFFAFFLGRIGRAGGKWRGHFESDNASHSEEVICRQFLHFVFGHSKVTWVTRSADGHDRHEERRYAFRGVFNHELLRATYWCRDPRVIDCGAFLLKYKVDGEGFSGKYIGVEGDDDARIESVPTYEWKKK